jgi:NADH-quinone oxidoreductase subunit H
LLLANTLSFREIVDTQSGFYLGFIPRWIIFQMPFPQIVSFFVFMVSAFAETNRVPFDLPEAENELVAGFHTEYSSMKFASFFMAEYSNMVTVCCVATLLFLGGWHPILPAPFSIFIPIALFAIAGAIAIFHGLNPARRMDKYTLPATGLVFLVIAAVFLIPILQQITIPLFWFAAKVGSLLFVFIWVRATLPRYRYDQLMRLAWTFLFPVAMVNLLVTSLMVALFSK